jgi:formylglycine-generating enzyme required for sulfatase activity
VVASGDTPRMPDESNAVATVLVLVIAGCASDQPPPPPTPEPRPTIKRPEDMVEVPAGWFRAGCSPPGGAAWRAGCNAQQLPRDVWLSRFAIDRLETSRAEYMLCVEAGACSLPRTRDARVFDHSSDVLPAEVTSVQAASYCEWRHARLPTQSEWQKAARGPTLRVYPWGDEPASCDEVAMVEDELLIAPSMRRLDCGAHAVPAPIGTHPKDRGYYGALDMGGNVHEWTSSWSARDDIELLSPGLSEPWEYRLVDPDVIDPAGLREDVARASWGGNRDRFDRIAMGGDEQHAIGGRPTRPPEWVPDPDDNEAPIRLLSLAGIRCARSLPGPAPPEASPEQLSNHYRITFEHTPKGQQRKLTLEPSAFTPEQAP